MKNRSEDKRIDRRSAITPAQRKNLAVAYVRTATSDHESEANQRELERYAQELGWPSDRIKIIEDLGHFASSGRPGFQQLMAMRDAGRIGLIIARDVSRLSRNPVELADFFRANRRANVLLHIPSSH